jgi:TP901 family phage tail tape measure protein
MADVNANIGINIDSSNALAQLKALQRQISQFHTSISRSSEAAALAQKGLQKNLLNSINAIGAFSAEMRTVRTSAESFTNSLEKNKFSMREYFRYAGASTKTFGRLFKSEFDTIGKVAEERVKRLQTQYIKMGRDTNGAMKAMGIMPTQLNMSDYTTKVQIAAQKQALFNQLMKQGSTNLLNFGKNTQWAGRQLMVGFTLPLMLVGSTATKTFMEMEAQALRFRKVYGDLFTPQSETQAALDNITELGKQFTKYGVSVSQTVGLAAEAAAAGFQGLDLQRQTAQATRLSILGQVESQKALETTISLQNAFGMSSEKLAESIDFLNAVENQTVVSLDDITTAIPKVAPVIQQLGGDVKDLTFFMAAMKEGGINASEGANALKSGLAALINPTKKAADMLASYGINATAIVENNKGDLKATVIGFAEALNRLDPLARARAIEQMFGKFQFARLSTLFANVAKDGNQASRVLDLANSSVEQLSALSEQELGMTADSAMNKFKKSVEDLKFALVPVGEAFLQALTPIIEFVGGILEKFSNLSDGTKKLITLLTVGIGAVGPVLLMTFGLLANGIANIIKLFLTLRGGYQRLSGQTSILGEQTQYMTMEQLDAAAAAHSLNQTHATLTQTFTAERAAVNQLISAYNSAAGAARNFSMNNPGMMMPGRGARKLASGIVSVPGPKGAGDIVPAMLSPGEAVIPAKFVEKYGPLIDGMVSGNIPGYQKGRSLGTAVDVPGGMDVSHFGTKSSRTGKELLAMVKGLETSAARNIEKMVTSFEDGYTRAFTTFDNQVVAQFTEINRLMQTQGKASTERVKQNLVGAGFAETRDIELQRQLVQSGTSIDEFKLINKQITQEVIKGFDALGDKTEITSEELNNLLRKAYEEVAKTDARVEKAYNNMKQVSSVFSPDRAGVRGSRIPITEESYIKQKKSTQRTSSQYRKMQGQMVGAENIPYAQSSRFVVTNNIAKELGLSSKQAAAIYQKMSTDAKVTLSRMRNDLTAFKKEFIIEAARVGEMVGTSAVNATAKAAGTASPSRKTRRTGEDIGRGLEEGMKSRQDDVALVGSQLGQAATGGVRGGSRQIPFTAPGQPGSVARNIPTTPGININDIAAKARFNRDALLSTQAQKQTAKMNARMGSLNKAFMSGTFALSALSGVASMAGGNLGKFSQILFNITGPLFALSSILQLLTGSPILKLIANVGKLKFGVAAGALIAFTTATKLINDARKKELEYIYGLSNAMKTTTGQVKTLGDFFGVVPTKLPSEMKNREIVKQPARTARDRLREDAAFQKEYAPTIKTLSKSTAEEAKLVFTSMALDLKARGFATEQIQTIVDALREEAGKTSVELDVKSINFSPESMKSLQNQITGLLVSFNKNFDIKPTGAEGLFQGFKNSFLQAFQGKTPGTLDLISNSAKKAMAELTAFSNNIIGSAAGQFRLGIINVDQFKESVIAVTESYKRLGKEQENLLLLELFKTMGVDATKLLPILDNVITKNKLIMLSGLGMLSPSIIAGLQSTDLQVLAETFKQIDRDLAKYEKVVKAIENAAGLSGNETKTKVELKGLAAKIQALKDQTEAFTTLIGKQVDFKTALELTNDAEIVKRIIDINAIKNIKQRNKEMKEFIGLTKTYIKVNQENQDTVADPRDKEIARLDNLQKFVALNEKLIDLRAAPQIKAFNDELEKQEGLLQNVNDEIQQITKDQIEPIQKIIDANSYALQAIALLEDEINEKYNDQITALDKIEKANQNIANIQKQRMSIADALTRGDISAAAQAMQDARSENAQSALTGQRDTLTRVRDESIAALGRVEIEKTNKVLQLQIATIERGRLLTLQGQKTQIEAKIEATNRELKVINTKVEKEKESSDYAGKTRLEIDKTKTLLELSKGPLDAYAKQIAASATSAKELADAIERALKASKLMSGSGTLNSSSPTYYSDLAQTLVGKPGYTGMTVGQIEAERRRESGNIFGRGKMYGGMISKYMAFGGRAIGSDTVPAMLTPGEFVMNKAASKAYGPLLERINESKYPGMLGGGGMTQIPVNNISTSMNDNSTAVYNYNLGFSINGANGSAKDIANAVMREIKNVDSQRIRGQRR